MNMSLEQKKICIHCDQEKDISQFANSECHTSGKDNRCRDCRNAINREHRRRKRLGLVTPRQRIKRASQVKLEPFDEDLEARRRIQNLIKQFGHEGAKAKIKLEAFAT